MASFDSGALGDLEEIYCRLLAAGRVDYRDTWRAFAANERYQYELRTAAARLLRQRRLSAQRAEDVVQDALLMLAKRLERHSNLGFDPRYGREHFLGWLRALVYSQCRQVLRRQRSQERRGPPIDNEWAAVHAATAGWRAEMADAIQSLDEPLREIVDAFARWGSIAAVAERLDLSSSTAWRRFRQAVKQLRPRCRPFAESGRLIGVPNVEKKW